MVTAALHPGARVTTLQRGNGAAELRLVRRAEGTAIAHLYQRTPMRALFPVPEPGDPFTAVLVTTSGGIAGGDRLAVSVDAGDGTCATVTAQAAEKIYRCADEAARIDTHVAVAPGAWLEWLPQETILFDGAKLRRSIEFAVASGGRLLASEILVLGRTARGERFRSGRLLDRWRVRRDGELAWADTIRIDDEAPLLHRAGFDGAASYGTVLYVGADAAERCAAVRDCLAGTALRAGATVVGGVLLARVIGATGQTVRQAVMAVVAGLRAAAAGLPPQLPRAWMC